MSDEDKYALKEFRNGVALTLGVIGIAMLIIVALSMNTPELKASFEVVDTYKGCDVVRYAPHQLAEYKYFLHCENK